MYVIKCKKHKCQTGTNSWCRPKHKTHTPRHVCKFAAKMWTTIENLSSNKNEYYQRHHGRKNYRTQVDFHLKDRTYKSNGVLNKVVPLFCFCLIQHLLDNKATQAAKCHWNKGINIW